MRAKWAVYDAVLTRKVARNGCPVGQLPGSCPLSTAGCTVVLWRSPTLRDYRWLLAEPGQTHRRGSGAAPGLMMRALGERAANELTTRDIAEYSTGTAPVRGR